jgi:hypothetical protein
VPLILPLSALSLSRILPFVSQSGSTRLSVRGATRMSRLHLAFARLTRSDRFAAGEGRRGLNKDSEEVYCGAD